jgi:hypothetical protein
LLSDGCRRQNRQADENECDASRSVFACHTTVVNSDQIANLPG